MTPTWIKGSLLLLVTLGAGVGLGAAFRQHTGIRPHMIVARMDSADVMRRLDHELKLDPAQHATIAAIISRRQATIDSLWASVHPTVRNVIESTLHEILLPLRPEQRARYLEMVEQVHPGLLKPASHQ